MQEFQIRTSHRPRPLPSGRWAMTQRWNDLLFAHWPIPVAQMSALLPDWLDVDTFQGSAWLGAVPFWLDRIKIRGVPPIPGARSFPDLNLRTYVRDQFTGTPGFYCFSLDSSNLLAVAVARSYYHLPYYWSEMRLEQRSEREFAFYSRQAVFEPAGHLQSPLPGTWPKQQAGGASQRVARAFPHRALLPLQLQPPGRTNPCQPPLRSLAAGRGGSGDRAQRPAGPIGLTLPNQEPVLHYSRRLAVYIWPRELARPALAPVQSRWLSRRRGEQDGDREPVLSNQVFARGMVSGTLAGRPHRTFWVRSIK